MKEKIKNNNIIYFIIIIFIMGFICSTSTVSPFKNKYVGIDSSVFILVARCIKNGLVPYLDVFDHKGPLMYFINYVGLVINDNYIGIWILETLFAIISAIYIFKVANLFTNNKIKSIFVTILSSYVFITFLEEGNYTEEYALLFISISLYYFSKMLLQKDVIKKKHCFITGICFGAVLLLRVNMVTLWAVYYPIIAIKLLIEKRYKELINIILFSVLGMLAIILPFVIYFIKQNAWKDFIYDYLIFNFKYALLKSNSLISILLWVIKKCLVLIIVFLASMYNLIKDKEKSELYIEISSLFFLLLTLLIVILPGNPFKHYALILVPCVTIPIARIITYIKKDMVIIILMLAVSILLPYKIFKGYKNDNPEDISLVEVSKYIKETTSSNDKIIVIGNRCIFYLLSDRECINKYPYQYPISDIDKNIRNEVIEDIKNKKPKIIVAQMFDPETKKALRELVDKNIYYMSNEYKFMLIRTGDSNE